MQLLLNASRSTVSTVQDIPENYNLVQDSQDVDDILDCIGKQDERRSVGCLFVLVGDGEYTEVWLCPYYIPALAAPVRLIYKA